MIGSELFPMSDYYRENLIDAITITRGGSWWSAILLINDPNTKEPMISIYRWNKVNDEWKVRKSYNIRSKKEVDDIINSLSKFRDKLSK